MRQKGYIDPTGQLAQPVSRLAIQFTPGSNRPQLLWTGWTHSVNHELSQKVSSREQDATGADLQLTNPTLCAPLQHTTFTRQNHLSLLRLAKAIDIGFPDDYKLKYLTD